MSSRRRMPPEYVATLRVPAPVSEKRSSRSSGDDARVLEVPQPGDQDEVLPPAQDLVDRRELPGETDGLAYVGARAATSKPLTLAVPASDLSSVDRIFSKVVLPAPLEPSKAKMLPRATSKSTPRSTRTSLYDFSRPCTWIAGSWT